MDYSIDVRPDIVGEFEDSELLWEFGGPATAPSRFRRCWNGT